MTSPAPPVLQEDTAPPRRRPGARRAVARALLLAGGIVAAAAVAVVGLVVLVAGGVGGTRPLAIPRLDRAGGRLLAVSGFRDLALPRDGAMDPEEVGTMVEELGSHRRPSDPCDGAPAGSPVAARRHLPCLDHTAVFPAAARGFTPAERKHLEGLLGHPGLPVLEAMARAPGYARPVVDRAGGDFGDRTPVLPWEVPLPRLTPLREAAAVEVARAALLYEGGDVAGAEDALREVLSAGLLLVDDGVTLVEGLVGASTARMGLEALVQLYGVSGRDSDARRLAARIEAADPGEASMSRGGVGTAPAPSERLESVEARLVDPTTPRPLRWELAVTEPLRRSCRDVRAVLFGPPDSYRELMEATRTQLVRHPSDGGRFALVVDQVRRLHDRTRLYGDLGFEAPGLSLPRWAAYAAVPVEISATLLRNPRVDACFWVRVGAD